MPRIKTVPAEGSPGIIRAATTSPGLAGFQSVTQLGRGWQEIGGRPILRTLLDWTTQFSGPLVPTVLIRTGPQVQSGDRQFLGGDCPSRNRFGIVAQTFWAGHRLLLSMKFFVGYHWMKRMGLARSLVQVR